MDFYQYKLRWLNTVCTRFTDSVSDAIKGTLGLWYANTAVDKVPASISHEMDNKVKF